MLDWIVNQTFLSGFSGVVEGRGGKGRQGEGAVDKENSPLIYNKC